VESLVMTFPIKKRINTEMFIDRTAALYIRETRIRAMTNRVIEKLALIDWRSEFTLRRYAMLD